MTKKKVVKGVGPLKNSSHRLADATAAMVRYEKEYSREFKKTAPKDVPDSLEYFRVPKVAKAVDAAHKKTTKKTGINYQNEANKANRASVANSKARDAKKKSIRDSIKAPKIKRIIKKKK
jgi:hypothetical protein